MSEKQIASLKINEPEIEEIEPIVLPANDENEKKEVAPKSKLITTSSMQLNLVFSLVLIFCLF